VPLLGVSFSWMEYYSFDGAWASTPFQFFSFIDIPGRVAGMSPILLWFSFRFVPPLVPLQFPRFRRILLFLLDGFRSNDETLSRPLQPLPLFFRFFTFSSSETPLYLSLLPLFVVCDLSPFFSPSDTQGKMNGCPKSSSPAFPPPRLFFLQTRSAKTSMSVNTPQTHGWTCHEDFLLFRIFFFPPSPRLSRHMPP